MGGRYSNVSRRRVGRPCLALLATAVALLVLPAVAAAETVVSLTFDDSLTSQGQVRPLLSARQMHATFYVNSARIDEAGYLTRAQLSDLQRDGNEIGGHTVHHLDLRTVDRNEQLRQVCMDRNTLLGWGFSVTSFAYPFGSSNPEVASVVEECGYNSARGLGGVGSDGLSSESIPPLDPFWIRTVSEVTSSMTLSDLQGYVTRAEQSDGGWVTFVFHDVCSGCGTYAIRPSTLTAFLDWLVPRSGIGTTVQPVRAVVGGNVDPPVAAPPLPAVRSGNMVGNGSLETDADNDGVSDCWLRNKRGTNTATWTRTTDAHTGAFAERVDVTAYSSGAARLLSSQDLGFCAPTAVAGQIYKFGAWYKGTASPRLVAFYRTATGAWRVLAQSTKFSRSDRWKRATWAAPPLPAGANGVGIGVAVESVGSLTMDDLSITKAK